MSVPEIFTPLYPEWPAGFDGAPYFMIDYEAK